MKQLLKTVFQDDTGQYVTGQPPNIPVYLMLAGFVGSRVVTQGAWHEIFSFVLIGSLFTWAYLEIAYGASLFRRVLGGVVMIGACASFVGAV